MDTLFKVFLIALHASFSIALKTCGQKYYKNVNYRPRITPLQYAFTDSHSSLALLDTIIHAIRPIPVELSATDTIVSSATNTFSSLSSISEKSLILPNTEIQQLDGGFNLGILLWTFVLYYGGPLPSKMSLADTILPYIVKNSSTSSNNSEEEEQQQQQQQQQQDSLLWYKDYEDGYTFNCPPSLDLFRIALFAALGYVVNTLWIDSLGGDVYWGWATAGSLSIPTALIALGRVRRVSREVGMLENKIKANFREFRDSRLIRKKATKCNEDAILKAYQRTYGKFDYTTSSKSNSNGKSIDSSSRTAMYADTRNSKAKKGFGNTEDDITIGEMSEKILLRLMRGWYGSRPGVDGNYMDLELLPPLSTAVVSSSSSSSVTTAGTTATVVTKAIVSLPKASEFSVSSSSSIAKANSVDDTDDTSESE